MKRENQLLKTLKTKPAPKQEASDPNFDTYLAKINQEGKKEEKSNRLKPQSISLYPEDVTVIRQLRRFIEDETDTMNVSVSAIYRAALYVAVGEQDKFIEIFQKLK